MFALCGTEEAKDWWRTSTPRCRLAQKRSRAVLETRTHVGSYGAMPSARKERSMDSRLVRLHSLSGVVAAVFYFLHVYYGMRDYPGYSSLAQAVSDLTAVDAPSYVVASRLSALFSMFSVIGCTFVYLIVSARRTRPSGLDRPLHDHELGVSGRLHAVSAQWQGVSGHVSGRDAFLRGDADCGASLNRLFGSDLRRRVASRTEGHCCSGACRVALDGCGSGRRRVAPRLLRRVRAVPASTAL